MRQGCVLISALFSLYIAELDKALDLRNIRDIEIGRKRIWSLTYADGMILVTKKKEALENMLGSLKKFLKKRVKFRKNENYSI